MRKREENGREENGMTVEEMTVKYVAEWEKIRMSRIRNEHRRRWFQWEIDRFRATGRHLDLIPMYEAIIEVIERRYREGK